jgi:F-type H+-transporting ATPase subunit epsilon
MIEVDIVTPVRKLYEGVRANSVRLPSAQGELLVLPGHTELLALLGTGLLSIFLDGNERRFSVSAGFAEVRKDRVLVLAETCEEADDIDVERARKAQKRAEELLGAASTEEEFKKYQFKLQRALVRQQVAGRHS